MKFFTDRGFRIRRASVRIKGEHPMILSWALTFLVVAIIAGIFGFTGVAGTSAWIAQILFVIFLIVFLVSLFTGRRPPVT
jgi:uncharacterized membrane protein YtjA (UPF0391 family)